VYQWRTVTPRRHGLQSFGFSGRGRRLPGTPGRGGTPSRPFSSARRELLFPQITVGLRAVDRRGRHRRQHQQLVYRRNMGVPSMGAAVSTGKGIVFMNTANPERPELTILQRNQLGDTIERWSSSTLPVCQLCLRRLSHRYVRALCSCLCKTPNASANDTVLLCDIAQKTVDITSFNGRTRRQAQASST